MLYFKSLKRNLWEDQHEDASQETCHFHHLIRLSGKRSSRFMRNAVCILFFCSFFKCYLYSKKSLTVILGTVYYPFFDIKNGVNMSVLICLRKNILNKSYSIPTNLSHYNRVINFNENGLLL